LAQKAEGEGEEEGISALPPLACLRARHPMRKFTELKPHFIHPLYFLQNAERKFEAQKDQVMTTDLADLKRKIADVEREQSNRYVTNHPKPDIIQLQQCAVLCSSRTELCYVEEACHIP